MIVGLALLGCKKDNKDEVVSASVVPGEAPIRRLTGTEYNNTVFQLFGDASRPANAFAADEEAGGFDNQAAAQTVSALLAEQYQTAAEAVAVNNVDLLLSMAPGCAGGGNCDADAEQFVEDFGYQAFRRPLTDAEIGVYTDLFSFGTGLGEGSYDAEAGLSLVAEAMLQSPDFLYRIELGESADPGAATPFTSYEMASRLSYLLWGSMPDDDLFEAAEAGLLQDPVEIEYQARRMMAVPRARNNMKNFFGQWLGLDDIVTTIGAQGKDTDLFPDYRPSLLPLMVDETETFVEHVIFDEEASVRELFTANFTMLNAELAEFYGFDSTGLDERFTRVELDPDLYSGFLTHSGLLALHSKTNRSSPVHRGIFVRESLFCQNPPAMPEVIPEAPEVDTDQTIRDQFSQHSEDPACSGCHSLMDPIGFGFEHFDAVGRYQADYFGQSIDASGEIIDTKDANGTFDGVNQLGSILGYSEDVSECISTKWFMYAFGRADADNDEVSLEDMRDWFTDEDYDMRELVVATALTDSFRYRAAPDPDEVIQEDDE